MAGYHQVVLRVESVGMGGYVLRLLVMRMEELGQAVKTVLVPTVTVQEILQALGWETEELAVDEIGQNSGNAFYPSKRQ
jgi:hypothetical protein